MCQLTPPRPAERPWPSYTFESSSSVYIDPIKGSDTNEGTEASPFKTIAKGVTASRASSTIKSVVLRKGLHLLSDTITLTKADSGLMITNYPSEEAWVSGGIPLTLDWKPYNVSGANVYKAQVKESSVKDITGLMTVEPHMHLVSRTSSLCCRPNSVTSYRRLTMPL